MEQRCSRIRNKIWWLSTSKKDLYVYWSLCCCIALAGTVISDLVHYTTTDRFTPQFSTQTFTTSLLILNVSAFYVGLIGYVYATQQAGLSKSLAKLALLAMAGNLTVFIMRIFIEVNYINLRPEKYTTFTESGK